VDANAGCISLPIAVVEAARGDLPQAPGECGRAKGRNHPARLNLADCFAYAVAKNHGVPLLFKGDDFDKTDIADGR
jgi:uncharacterized protein with PIN domain